MIVGVKIENRSCDADHNNSSFSKSTDIIVGHKN